jgi:hypothetical protein
MEVILDTNKAYDSFDFSTLQLIKPTSVSGGNYFIRCLVDENPLYIQPPKCSTKQGIVKTGGGKRFYTDLMFTNENETFIHWMEKLETYCQQTIFKNREQWFDNDLELGDIECYFTSPLKIYKSGKFYIARINVSTVLGKPTIKIYNENEEEISFDTITDKINVMTILEIQGIKCSAKSFQIEIELKQMMALKQQILFDKCLFKTKTVSADISNQISDDRVISHHVMVTDNTVAHDSTVTHDSTVVDDSTNIVLDKLEENTEPPILPPNINKSNELEEVDLHLEELAESESIQIKQRNEVYYEMYRDARKKAKIARDLALTAYLEAKQIKNTYMLTDLNSDSDSDFDGHGLGDSNTNNNDTNDTNDTNYLEDDIEEIFEPV